jgi:superfamily II DNA/RNA helicase
LTHSAKRLAKKTPLIPNSRALPYSTVRLFPGLLAEQPSFSVGRNSYRCIDANLSEFHRDKAIQGFAPISTGAPPGDEEDQYDLLLCTDILVEGLNLQQCRNIINYDLPWNPTRLVQRHGRIDRIGSRHKHVYLRTFFPDVQLNELLNLKERVQRKLAHAAASVGVEVTPIERGAIGEQSFAEAGEEIERLYRENALA